MINKRLGMPNTNGPIMESQSSHPRSSVKKLRLERGTLGTDGEEKCEARDCYGIVSGDVSDRRKCAEEDVGLSKARHLRNLHEL
jgi:hypothetical protein